MTQNWWSSQCWCFWIPSPRRPTKLTKWHMNINAIWSYWCKHCPNGDIHKYKSCICVDGSQQHFGIDYWDTYTPVIQWSTICLLFILATTLGLSSCQIDYVQAFLQAALNNPVYMKVPQGWFYCLNEKKLCQFANPKHTDPSYFIKLKCNLYGCKQATFNWYQHLVRGLLAWGFNQSTSDPCLFIWNDCIIALYTDNCCAFLQSTIPWSTT